MTERLQVPDGGHGGRERLPEVGVGATGEPPAYVVAPANACDSGVGTGTPLPSPCEPMPPSVADRIRTDRASWPAEPARTFETEGVATDRVAADPTIVDTELQADYSDGVQHHRNLDRLGAPAQGAAQHSARVPQAEAVRLSRLSRWQEQR